MMRGRVSILLGVLFSLSCIVCFAQEVEVKRNAFCVIAGGYVSPREDKNYVDVFPVISLWYNRNVWHDVSLGAGYLFLEGDPRAYWISTKNGKCLESDHAILFSFANKFSSKNLFLSPSIAAGLCLTNYTVENSTTRIKSSVRLAINPGATFGISSFEKNYDVYISYNFFIHQYRQQQKKTPVDGVGWDYSSRFGYHVISFGVGYSF